MEAVYLSKPNQSVSENIFFKGFFEEFSKDMSDHVYNTRTEGKQIIKKYLGLNDEEYLKLSKKCNPHPLCAMRKIQSKCGRNTPPGFRKGFKEHELPDDVGELKSLQHLKNRTEAEQKAVAKALKYPGQVDLDPGTDVLDLFTKKDLVPYQDFVLTVRIYVPWKHRREDSKKLRAPQVSQEFRILGRMTLEKLRDRIACPEDFQDVSPDVSESPHTSSETRSGDVYKSAMFYIGNNFYIDTRHKDNIDYSEVIREWASWKKLEFGETLPMEDTTVDSLVCRMGYPYVYVHQGCCEHVIVITDARLLHPRDVQISGDYPVMISFSALKGMQCDLCKVKVAKYIVRDSPKLPYDNAFLCNSCTFLYNYVGEKKVANFKMYKYVDRLAIL